MESRPPKLNSTTTPMRLSERRNQCPSCGTPFGGFTAFDQHRTGPFGARRCMTHVQMKAKGLRPGASGFWGQDFEAADGR